MSCPVTPPRCGTNRPAPYPSRRESIEPLLPNMPDVEMDIQESPSPIRVAHGSSSPGDTVLESSVIEWCPVASHGIAGFTTPPHSRHQPGPKQPSPAHARTSEVSPWLKYEPYMPPPPPPLPPTPNPAPRRRARPEGGLLPGGLGAVGMRFQEGLDACTSTLRRVASTSILARLPPSPPSLQARRKYQTVPMMRRKAYKAQKIAIPSILRSRRRKHGSTSPKKNLYRPEMQALSVKKLLDPPFRLRN